MNLPTLASRKDAADKVLGVLKSDIESFTQRMMDGGISLGEWQAGMKDRLRIYNSAQLLAGAGGDPDKVTRADRLRLGPEMRRQYSHLSQFAKDIASGKTTGGSILSRAAMYANSTQASFWRKAMPVKLPAVPKDGSTDCRTNCLCHWRVEYEYNDTGDIVAVLAYWEMEDAEHCETCNDRNEQWYPLRIEVEPGFVPDLEEAA